MGKVIERLGHSVDAAGFIHYDDRPVTWDDADLRAGVRLDRRKNWAFVGGRLCDSVTYTRNCSGCSYDTDYGSSRGGGCEECGYHGVIRCSEWIPVIVDCGETPPAAPPSTRSPDMDMIELAERERETFATCAAWAEKTFGPATPKRRLERAGEELAEALMAPPDKLLEEIADTVICLAAAAHSAGGDLQAAIDAKMAINRGREWRVLGDGTGYHVPRALSAKDETP